MFSTFGLGYTATKYVADFASSKPEKLKALFSLLIKITAITSLFLCLLVFIFSHQIAVFIKAPNLSYPIRLCSIIIVLNGLTLTQIGILSGLNKYRIIARNSTLSGILSFVLCCVLTYSLGFDGAMYSLLISQAFNFFINRLSILQQSRDLEYAPINSEALIRQILSFSLPVALQESCVFIFGWLFTYTLIALSNYGEVGIHSAAAQWSAIILFVPGVLRNVTLSHLSGTNSDVAHKRIMKAMILTNIAATVLPYIFIVLFNDLIVKIYGPTYTTLGVVMLILNASTIPNCVSNVYVQEFMSINKNWYVFILRLTKDLLSIYVLYSLIGRTSLSGAVSAAIAVTSTSTLYLASLCLIYNYIKQHGITETRHS